MSRIGVCLSCRDTGYLVVEAASAVEERAGSEVCSRVVACPTCRRFGSDLEARRHVMNETEEV